MNVTVYHTYDVYINIEYVLFSGNLKIDQMNHIFSKRHYRT